MQTTICPDCDGDGTVCVRDGIRVLRSRCHLCRGTGSLSVTRDLRLDAKTMEEAKRIIEAAKR